MKHALTKFRRQFKILFGAAALFAVSSQNSNAQLLNVGTLSGNGGALDSTGIFSQLNNPRGILLSKDSSQLYWVENHSLRVVNLANGRTRTIAGKLQSNNTLTNGVGSAAWFNFPASMTHGWGDSIIYIADQAQQAGNFTNTGIRRVNVLTGRVTTPISGSLVAVQGVAADPAADGADTIFISATAGVRRYILNPAGGILSQTTLVPVGTGSGTDASTVNRPRGLRIIRDTLYIADNGRILAVNKYSGQGRVIATGLSGLLDISVLGNNIIMANSGNTLVGITTLTGTTVFTINNLSAPYGSSIGRGDSVIYFSEPAQNRIRLFNRNTNTVSNFVGRPGNLFDGDSIISSFVTPSEVRFFNGKLYVADRGNNALRIVDTANGSTSSISGLGTTGIQSLVVRDSIIYFTENSRNGRFAVSQYDLRARAYRRITGNAFTAPAGQVLDGNAQTAQFKYPMGLAIDKAGRYLYVGSTGGGEGGHSIRRIDLLTDSTETIAGSYPTVQSGYQDGIGRNARFNDPSDLAWLNDSVLVIADAGNRRIRTMNVRTLQVGTLAGNGVQSQTPLDSPNGLTARLISPSGLLVDTVRNFIFFTDQNRIRRISLLGTNAVTTVAGEAPAYRDGVGSFARFNGVNSLTFGPGNRWMYASDANNNRIRKVSFFANTAPSFTAGPDVSALENAGPITIPTWATQIIGGSRPEESTQIVNFLVSNNNPSLFQVQPTISTSGDLTFRSAVNAFGAATVRVMARDNGGIEEGGVDSSAAITFVIRIDSVNNAPVYTVTAANSTLTRLSNAGTVTVNNWATAVAASNNPNFEQWQALQFELVSRNPSFYTTAPSVALTPAAGGAFNGNLSFTVNPAATGRDTLALILRDNGGRANGGIDSIVGQLIIVINPFVNVAPSFTVSATNSNLSYGPLLSAPVTTVNNFATAVNPGNASEASQTLEFIIRSTRPDMYAVAPAIAISGTGTNRTGVLTFTQSGVPGTDTLTLVLKDNGGAFHGGVDTVLRQVFITVTTNQAPVFNVSAANSILNYPSLATNNVTLTNWATGVTTGAANEVAQSLAFTVVSSNPALYTTQPTVEVVGTGATRSGTLRFQLAGVNGRDTLSVLLRDNGGIFGGGVDSLVRTLIINVGVESLNNSIVENLFSIYPNPTNGILNINLSGEELGQTGSIRILDLGGKEVATWDLSEPKQQINIQDLPKGFYWAEVLIGNKRSVKKVIKQ